jgi:hypothetical protein
MEPPKAGYDLGGGLVRPGDDALYAGELPCKVLDVAQDGEVTIRLSDGNEFTTKWRNVWPWR